MKRKWKKRNQSRGFPAGILFVAGYLLGIAIPNFIWSLKWQQQSISAMYLLETFGEGGIAGKEFFLEVLRIRGSYLLLCVLCGFSVFGAPLAVVTMLGMGLEMGMVLTMSILQFGFGGGAVGIGFYFPQMIIYLPVTVYLMGIVYGQSREMWKSGNMKPLGVRGYVIRSMAALFCYGSGILLESYVNPILMEAIAQKMNFF